jgi:hypothetical protein
MTGRIKLYLTTAVILGLLTNFSHFVSDASAGPLSMGYTSRQMNTSGSDSSQTLTASGGSGSYTWSIPGGSGTLSNSNGSSTVYTAPISNANCVNNPTVRLMDSTGQYVDLPMAVNGYPYLQVEAVRITADDWCNPGQTITSCGMNTYHYNCQGELIPNFNQHDNPCASATNHIGSSCAECYGNNICDACSTICGGVAYKLSLSPEDRTLPFPNMRNGGCCAWNAPQQPGPNDTGNGCSRAATCTTQWT